MIYLADFLHWAWFGLNLLSPHAVIRSGPKRSHLSEEPQEENKLEVLFHGAKDYKCESAQMLQNRNKVLNRYRDWCCA